MPTLGKSLKEYVSDRWVGYLVHALEVRDDTRRFLYQDERDRQERASGQNRSINDWKGLIDIPALAKYIVRHGRDGENERSWQRCLNRWFNESAHATPEMVRRTLLALQSDWVLGLGRVGYERHAIAMIFELWKQGHYTQNAGAALYAYAIFCPSEWSSNDHGQRADAALLKYALCDETDDGRPSIAFKRLEAAAHSIWDAKALPTVCSQPPGLGTEDRLLRMWMMIEAAATPGGDSYRVRMNAMAPMLAQTAREWAQHLFDRTKLNTSRIPEINRALASGKKPRKKSR